MVALHSDGVFNASSSGNAAHFDSKETGSSAAGTASECTTSRSLPAEMISKPVTFAIPILLGCGYSTAISQRMSRSLSLRIDSASMKHAPPDILARRRVWLAAREAVGPLEAIPFVRFAVDVRHIAVRGMGHDERRESQRDSQQPMSHRDHLVDVVDGALVGGQRRFVQRFGQRRMRMDRALQVFAAGGIFHRQHRFGDQLAGQRPDDVHAQDLVVILRGDQLDEARGRLPWRARGRWRRTGNWPILYARPLALTCSSVWPTQAISGAV